jgi:hypothetical protein
MFARTIWIVLAVVVLAVTLLNFDPESNPDISIFLFYAMLVLSFPAGLLLAGILSYGTIALHSMLGIEIGSNHGSILVMWIAFLVVGYGQWFVLLPYLRSRFRK